MNKLKDCPFCGSNIITVEITDYEMSSYYEGYCDCSNCGATSPYTTYKINIYNDEGDWQALSENHEKKLKQEAIKLWNKRANDKERKV